MTHLLNITNNDVWGNSEDGYEVNQAFYSSYNVEIDEDDTDEQIVQKLKNADWLEDHVEANSLTIEGEPEFGIYITVTECGYPLTALLPRIA